MLNINEAEMQHFEDLYPGITKMIFTFENAKLPACPNCGSKDTADVQVGIIGRTIHLASATSKFTIVPNSADKKGKYLCNECKRFFD